MQSTGQKHQVVVHMRAGEAAYQPQWTKPVPAEQHHLVNYGRTGTAILDNLTESSDAL